MLEQRRDKGRFRSLKEYKTDAGTIGTSSAGSLPKGKEKAVEPLVDFVSTTHDPLEAVMLQICIRHP
jgi:hypothetical protein